jgi:hypothetical protein
MVVRVACAGGAALPHSNQTLHQFLSPRGLIAGMWNDAQMAGAQLSLAIERSGICWRPEPAAGVLLLQAVEQAAEPWAMVQFGVCE